jgi:hypothetical protein
MSEERRKRLDAISGSFLAFAAMMKQDYGISKEVAVLAIAAAYDTNEDEAPKRKKNRTPSIGEYKNEVLSREIQD